MHSFVEIKLLPHSLPPPNNNLLVLYHTLSLVKICLVTWNSLPLSKIYLVSVTEDLGYLHYSCPVLHGPSPKLQNHFVAFQPNSVGPFWSGDLRHRWLQMRAEICDLQLVTDSLWLLKRSPTIRKGDKTGHTNETCSKNQKESFATRIRIQQPQDYQSADTATI